MNEKNINEIKKERDECKIIIERLHRELMEAEKIVQILICAEKISEEEVEQLRKICSNK